ncbi:DUF3772 domain-containing protein [Roseovarius carneus]|uniref:DUF3772 domain-containing protein n=1 Tax=Roseovarius carneus TaxID=2853164 RepID=UPI001CCFB950|nr:DUF3772 domain-containing protein [Roseovarius carneus]
MGSGFAPGFNAGSVHAQQTDEAPDYDRWALIASRASEAVEAARASTGALEDLRTLLFEWRDRFNAAQNVNANAIATAEAQLRALGPAPAEAAAEGSQIAAQRVALNSELINLREPIQRAQVAYSRADGLIKSIDRIIRERQTEKLMELGPSPVNPQNWPDAVSAFRETIADIRAEVSKSLRGEVRRAEFYGALPLSIVLTLIGFVLLLRGRFWATLALRLVMPKSTASVQWVLGWIMSMGEIVVPFIGYLLINGAVYNTGLVGIRGDLILTALTPAVLIFLVARWLALRCFPRGEIAHPPLVLGPEDRRSGRLYGGALGLVISIFYFVRETSQEMAWSNEADVVVLFPVMVLAGLILIRLSRLLTKHARAASEDEAFDTYRNRLTRLLAKALFLLALVAPFLGGVGYFTAAESLLLPSVLSLLLLAALLIFQRVINEVYVLANGGREEVREDLMPVLLGFGMVVLSLPAFALVWGARVADLSELWVRFTKGITLGNITISPTIFLMLAVVFAMGYVLTRLLQGTLKNTVLPKTKMDAGGRNAIVSGVGYIGIFLSALIAITSAGLDLSSIAIVAGALSVGIGFGLQNIVSNFVSGIILLIERPISQGDWIEVNGQHGTVQQISVRSTRIQTFDRSDLIIPNADLVSGTVTNYTRGNTVGRVIVPVGVAYGTDTRRVEGILREIARAHPMVLMNPEPTILMKGFGADSLDFEIRAILRDVNWIMSVHSDMNHEIAKRFVEEGIEIPFGQRDIWIRNPEALMGGTPIAPNAPEPKTDTPTEARERRPGEVAQRVAEGGSVEGDGGGDK